MVNTNSQLDLLCVHERECIDISECAYDDTVVLLYDDDRMSKHTQKQIYNLLLSKRQFIWLFCTDTNNSWNLTALRWNMRISTKSSELFNLGWNSCCQITDNVSKPQLEYDKFQQRFDTTEHLVVETHIFLHRPACLWMWKLFVCVYEMGTNTRKTGPIIEKREHIAHLSQP